MKQAAMQLLAGGTAGLLEVVIMQPLDLVKTRMQLQAQQKAKAISDPHYYTGVTDCVWKMYKYEGVTSFWKGSLPPIVAETVKRSIKFATFEQCVQFFMFGAAGPPTPVTYITAGLGAGIAEAVCFNPFEVVKVNLMSSKSKESLSSLTVTKNIVREHGFGRRGLSSGLLATIYRNGIFNLIYFGFYHSVKNMVPQYKEPVPEFLRKFAIGFTSGALGSVLNTPFDVAKTRIQGPQPQPGVVKYDSTMKTILIVYREEGYPALYKGLVPKILRLGPGGAMMLLAYEYVYNFLEQRFLTQ